MLPEAILFDLDGTLIDDEKSWKDALSLVCSDVAQSHPHIDTDALYKAYIDVSNATWSRSVADVLTEDLDTLRHRLWREALVSCACEDEALALITSDSYSRHRATNIESFADTVAALDALSGRYRLAIITNGYHDTQTERIRTAGLDGYFELVLSASELGYGKPDPRIFHHVLDKLALRPETTWYVGDSLAHDVLGAHNAGLRSIWLNRNARSRPPEHAEPHHEITTLADLLTLLSTT